MWFTWKPNIVSQTQEYLVLVCYVLLHFIDSAFFTNWRFVVPFFSSSICSHCVSVGNSSNSSTFIMFVMVMCDFWCCYCKKIMTCWRLRWWAIEHSLIKVCTLFSPVQFNCSVVSDSLRPHGLQHVCLPCPSPTPGACSNSSPSSWWYHPTISSSVTPSSHLQSLPASGSFPMSQFFESGGQSIGASASTSVLPMISFRMDWLDLLAVQGTLTCTLMKYLY